MDVVRELYGVMAASSPRAVWLGPHRSWPMSSPASWQPYLTMFRVTTSIKSKQQLELVNGLLVTLLQRLKLSTDPNGNIPSAEVVDLVASPMRVLRALQRDQQLPASP